MKFLLLHEINLLQDNLYRLQRPFGSRKRTSSGSEEQNKTPHPALRESLESSRDALETSQSGITVH